ncbi:Hpt domain-containing protein [Phormidesmis priestleyi]
MQSVKQQQILGYFIEEAKEHLDTIEHGLVDLQGTMSDSERVNELFRAAHSVKGGAAMLGFDSIQRTAHHFEDCFKHLKEHPVQIDSKLEDLFLKGFDTLKALVEALQGPFGLREEDAQQAVIASEPTFTELQKYLQALMKKGSGSSKNSKTAIASNATAQTTAILKAMLHLFRQADSTKSRQQLVALCNRLIQVSPTTKSWVTVLQMAQRAISSSYPQGVASSYPQGVAAPKNSYGVLAPIVIRDLKQASDLLISGRVDEILASQNLQKLIALAQAPKSAPQSLQSRRQSAPKQQVSIALEPRAAARTLLEVFNKSELIEIAEFLMKAIQ